MIEKRKPGDLVRHDSKEQNEIAEAVNRSTASQYSLGTDPKRGRLEPDVVLCQNGSCDDFERFDVVELFEPVVKPVDDLEEWAAGSAIFRANTPTDSAGRIAILAEALGSCGMVVGITSGVARTKVSINDESHKYAKPVAGSRRLVSTDDASAPCEILWRDAGTGVRYADVRISNAAGGQGTTSTTTTTTTTTAGQVVDPTCNGSCKWIWSAASGVWYLSTNNCSATTSTTTTTGGPTTTTTGGPTSTTTSTTTSTCCPFPAGAPTTSTSTTTTTGGATSTSTTTTTAGPCGCLYPAFCGDVDGECTFTYCSTGTNAPPTCEPGTTTTGGPTTTTCDCNTTTTAGPTTTSADPCSLGCDWVGVPTSGGWVWRISSYGCLSWYCPCPYPTSDPYCNTDHTECIIPPPTTTTAPPGCTGSCIYWWVPALGSWVLTSRTCSGGTLGCNCGAPSSAGSICAPTSTPCVEPTTTTTASPTTTTAAACAHCYTTTTTSTSTTTTPCGASCKWQWSTISAAWSIVSNPCASSCPCSAPAYSGSADCEVAWSPCAGTTTTTTTTAGPTTTTTTTTTCAPCSTPPAGYCSYKCDGGVFAYDDSNCNPDGSVCYHTAHGQTGALADPCYDCECLNLECQQPTTTTTTTTTACVASCSGCTPSLGQCSYVYNGSAWSLCMNWCQNSIDGSLCSTPAAAFDPTWLASQETCNNCLAVDCTTTTTTCAPSGSTACYVECINGVWSNINELYRPICCPGMDCYHGSYPIGSPCPGQEGVNVSGICAATTTTTAAPCVGTSCCLTCQSHFEGGVFQGWWWSGGSYYCTQDCDCEVGSIREGDPCQTWQITDTICNGSCVGTTTTTSTTTTTADCPTYSCFLVCEGGVWRDDYGLAINDCDGVGCNCDEVGTPCSPNGSETAFACGGGTTTTSTTSTTCSPPVAGKCGWFWDASESGYTDLGDNCGAGYECPDAPDPPDVDSCIYLDCIPATTTTTTTTPPVSCLMECVGGVWVQQGGDVCGSLICCADGTYQGQPCDPNGSTVGGGCYSEATTGWPCFPTTTTTTTTTTGGATSTSSTTSTTTTTGGDTSTTSTTTTTCAYCDSATVADLLAGGNRYVYHWYNGAWYLCGENCNSGYSPCAPASSPTCCTQPGGGDDVSCWMCNGFCDPD